MYKLLALDMDGTTLNSQKKITPKTVDAINKLLKSGVEVVVASGRCLAELSDYRNEFRNMHYVILTSGGLIYNLAADKPISIYPVSFEDCIKLIEIGEEENAMVHLLTIKNSVAKPQDIENISDFGMGVYYDMFNRICVRSDDLKKYAIDHKEDVMKINLYHRSIESRDRNVERLKNSGLQIVFAEANNIEASPLNVTKASGLIELCKILNIDIKDTVAIGDALNDLEILQTVGYSVAMGNADEEIKQIADYVTADNDHDGVALAIKRIFNLGDF